MGTSIYIYIVCLCIYDCIVEVTIGRKGWVRGKYFVSFFTVEILYHTEKFGDEDGEDSS